MEFVFIRGGCNRQGGRAKGGFCAGSVVENICVVDVIYGRYQCQLRYSFANITQVFTKLEFPSHAPERCEKVCGLPVALATVPKTILRVMVCCANRGQPMGFVSGVTRREVLTGRDAAYGLVTVSW